MAPRDVPSFFTLLPDQTVHVCSISKSLCAGLRVAFLAFPGKYREALSSGMLHINLKTVSVNGEIIAELIENGTAFRMIHQKVDLARQRNRIFQSVFDVKRRDTIARFFYWVALPAHLTSEEMELLAAHRGVQVLESHRFAMGGEEKSSYIRVSVASPDTEEDLENGLRIRKHIFEDYTASFFV